MASQIFDILARLIFERNARAQFRSQLASRISADFR